MEFSEERINNIILEYKSLKDYLLNSGQVSFEMFSSEMFRKYLLISCASLFENMIQYIIITFVQQNTESEMVIELVNNKVISRQYHTYFDWKNRSANSFYKLFGSVFSDEVKERIRECDDLRNAEKDFLEIGHERNMLVHENFLEYQLNKSVDDISLMFFNAMKYIEFLKKSLIKSDC